MADIEDLPGIEEVIPQKTPIYRRERHLASAITLTEIEYILTHQHNPAALRPHHRRVLSDTEEYTILPATGFLSWCVANLESWCDPSKEEKVLMRRAERVAHLAMEATYTHFYRTPVPDLVYRSLPLNTTYADLAMTWARVISQVAQSQEPRQELVIGKVKTTFDAELCIIYVTSRTCFLIPYSLVLCFADMCAAWFSVTCYAAIFHDKYPGYSLYQEVEGCLQSMLSLLKGYQQQTYILLKMWPSLVIGAILRDLESSPEFLTTITHDISPYLKNTRFYKLVTGVITDPTHAMLALELAGLWKTMGHPIVNMHNSTRSWFTKGTVMKRGLELAGQNIDNMFKKEFCRQYYKIHKKWPNVLVTDPTNEQVNSCLHANEWGETSTHKWAPEDFEGITLLKNFEFNYHIDTIDIISDKAIIPGRSEWIHEYDTKAFRTLHGHMPRGPPSSTKSVVMHFLTTEVFDCREILGLIDKGVIPSEWRVMVAVPKEREFKENDARCFGKMTPEMRAYQVVTMNLSPNKSPCSGTKRAQHRLRSSRCHNRPERLWLQFSGIQRGFC